MSRKYAIFLVLRVMGRGVGGGHKVGPSIEFPREVWYSIGTWAVPRAPLYRLILQAPFFLYVVQMFEFL
jgi:hypothetical protein